MTRSRLLLLPASIVLGATVLAGCSSGTTTAESTSTSASQAAASQAPASMSGSDLAQRMLTAVQKAGTVKYTTSTTGAGTGTTTTEAVYSGDKVSAHMTMSGSSAMEMIALDNASKVYIKSAAANVPTWTLVEESSSNPIVKAIATQLSSMQGSLNPSSSMKLFAQASEFKKAGTESVDGVDTTQYAGELPLSALFSLLGGDKATPTASSTEKPLAVQVYLDKDDRPIQVIEKGTISGQSFASTVKYSGYGSDIKVTAPKIGS